MTTHTEPVREADAGLTAGEVAERVAAGATNDVPTSSSRSVAQIVRANVLTRINAIFSALFVIIVVIGPLQDALFGVLIVANSGIGIFQEVRAKRTLDRLAIVSQARPRVRRDGVVVEVATNEIVLDDVLDVGPGDQIVVDGDLVAAEGLEIDESLLTGEADPVVKRSGDGLLSGSFVVAGTGRYRAGKVGREAYAARLAEEASAFTLVRSELRGGLDRILRFITFLLVPAGALTVYNQLSGDEDLPDALRGMVAALVPMVPEGLVLMTSVAFAVGVVRLGRRRCLVQELPAIEGLARVDVVCADKTGTLTENGMRLVEVLPVAGPGGTDAATGPAGADGETGRAAGRVPGDEAAGADPAALAQVLAALAAADPRPNASIAALAEAYPVAPDWLPTAVAPFSSARKWSGTTFGEHGHWVLGAPDVLLPPDSAAGRRAEAIGARGRRVLLLARAEMPVDAPAAPGTPEPVALLVLEQKIRSDARETLDYFASQSVGVKVISGDNARSVGAVAAALGLPRADVPVDARALSDDPSAFGAAVEEGTVFGRVTPGRKREMVGALRERGHTVAMTGDGVNDVLALKDADIGVAMGAGSPATRAVAQIVLLDNRFATLPYVVAEGRRVIGNIERVANLFLTKTVYSVLLAIMVALASVPYPFLPRHVTIIAWFTIGIPAFLLSLAPNHERARSGFTRRVMATAVPGGVVIAAATFTAYLLAYEGEQATAADQVRAGTTALIALMLVALWVLAIVARPYEWWKVLLVAAMVAISVLLMVLPVSQDYFALDPSDGRLTLIGLACGGAGVVLVEIAWWLMRRPAVAARFRTI
jgi:cation-transporting ATPase E